MYVQWQAAGVAMGGSTWAAVARAYARGCRGAGMGAVQYQGACQTTGGGVQQTKRGARMQGVHGSRGTQKTNYQTKRNRGQEERKKGGGKGERNRQFAYLGWKGLH